jgi:hypothetical protein
VSREIVDEKLVYPSCHSRHIAVVLFNYAFLLARKKCIVSFVMGTFKRTEKGKQQKYNSGINKCYWEKF